MLHIIFYAFAIFAVGSAVFVITASNPVRSVLSLVVTFFAMSGIWMLLRAEFLSLILLLVYVGAVMTLFLFVVMMLNIDTESKQSGFVRYLPLGIIIVLLLTGITIIAIGPDYFGIAKIPLPQPEMPNYSNTQALGLLLYTQYAYPFEIAGVLLLAAIIAAITLTHRGPVRRRVQSVSDQVAASPATSVRLINMASEPKRGARS
jgi:NADH-quinone oxidoreductase subunit J